MPNEYEFEKECDEQGNVVKVTLKGKKESKPSKQAEPAKEAE